MTQHDEHDIRAHFSRLRDDDRADAPSFRALIDRARAHAGTSPRARVPALPWIAAAAGIVLLVGVSLTKSGDRELSRPVVDATPTGPGSPPSISDWTSPTASLLRTSGRDLLAPPPIRSSVF